MSKIDEVRKWKILVSMIAFAMAIRIALWPFALVGAGDSAARVYIAWKWLENPHWIVEGLWGPLHFYLIGGILALWPDPLLAPVGLHIVVASLAPALLWLFIRSAMPELESRAAVWAAVLLALYPLLISSSLEAESEPVTVTLLLASLWLVARARNSARRTTGEAVVAAVPLALATMTRYECWILIPIFGLFLWPNLRQVAAFLIISSFHPLLWMIGNWVYHNDPLFFASEAKRMEMTLNQRGLLSLEGRLVDIVRFLVRGMEGTTLPVTLVLLIGCCFVFSKYRQYVMWMIAPFAVLFFEIVGILRGVLVPKVYYTAVWGSMMFPCAAVAIRELGKRWGENRVGAVVTVLMVACMTATFSWPDNAALRKLSIVPVPWMVNGVEVRDLSEKLAKTGIKQRDGLILDDFGSAQRAWVSLYLRVHPDQRFEAPDWQIDTFRIDDLVNFLQRKPEGVMIIREGSRFSRHLGYVFGKREVDIGSCKVGLRIMFIWPWPKSWAQVKTERSQEEGRLMVIRYQVMGSDNVETYAERPNCGQDGREINGENRNFK